MADFIGANLLSTVQKKMFPNGIALDIMERLDSMTFVTEAPDCLDSFDVSRASVGARAYDIFKTYGKDSEQFSSACKDANMKIKVDSVETKYVADAEQTGSMSVYTFTDRRGNTATINDINVKACLEKEQKNVDNILQGVLDEILSGHITLPEIDEDMAA